ncbi:MAG TPA: glucokinase [Rhodospirillales bacterium]|jgi:glucokinase|nr:glucokinase [Rhodospirillales bacterium]
MSDGKEVRTALIADIGGTNVRFALSQAGGPARQVKVLSCENFPGPAAAARAYLEEIGKTGPAAPNHGAFAVASPITGDRVKVTNHPWSFSIAAMRRSLGLTNLQVINDFTAIALSVPRLTAADRLKVGGGEAAPDAPIAVLGPGTGLGVSGLLPTNTGWTPLETEGGHVTMAAANDREQAVLAILRQSFGHISAERVISGPGLCNLYVAICRLDGLDLAAEPIPDLVTERGLDGSCPIAAEALAMFSAMLGTIAADLALSLGALGGVYVAGGIVPKLGEAFATSPFRRRFEDKGRFSGYLAAIPTFVITHELPAFIGLSEILE